ncbi:hypothetical protein Tco_1414375, partial [Tanacetum coccineum]
METKANDLDHLVNYDNDNDVDDLGYESEVYLDEEEDEDENNHSNTNVVKRDITRLSKFRREYGKLDGIKLSVTVDALNNISGKHRALFSHFLGDMVREHICLKIISWKKRYFDVDLTVQKLVMNHLGQLLRNFKRKLRQTYILPNQNTLSKLNEVPAKYSVIVKAKEWVNFVKYTTTKEYKIENKEIEPNEEPSRGILWLKGRVSKDEEFPDDEIRSKETEDKIKEGTLLVDQGTDAMTLVLATGERILLLESQLDATRREREEKKLLIKSMSSKMSQTE